MPHSRFVSRQSGQRQTWVRCGERLGCHGQTRVLPSWLRFSFAHGSLVPQDFGMRSSRSTPNEFHGQFASRSDLRATFWRAVKSSLRSMYAIIQFSAVPIRSNCSMVIYCALVISIFVPNTTDHLTFYSWVGERMILHYRMDVEFVAKIDGLTFYRRTIFSRSKKAPRMTFPP